jgi:signal transduction histidine kinase
MRFAGRCASVVSMPKRLDLAIAAVLLVVSQVEVWAFGIAGGGVVAAVCIGTIAVVSAWRTRFPLASVTGIFVAAFVCAQWSGQPGSVTFAVADLLAFYRLGTLTDRRRAYGALLIALVVGVAMTDHLSFNKYLAVAVGSFLVPWLVGALSARHQRVREVEREQQRAVEEERARLARELHDLVSHTVGMIAVQAGAGDVLLDREPERARDALRAIESGARDALLELRRLLGLLRDDGGPELAPQPTLARLDELVERMRGAGIDVAVRVEGDRVPLDPAVDLSAYRIVQEALTNVLKHAQAARAEIALRWRPDGLEIEVQDDGRGPAASGGGSGGGNGLVGIAERVALLGGEVETGPAAPHGFRVRALLPLGAATA